jgi:hypothetical protein
MRTVERAVAALAIALCLSCGGRQANDEPTPLTPARPEDIGVAGDVFVDATGATAQESADAIVAAYHELGVDADSRPFVRDLILVEAQTSGEDGDEIVFVQHGPWPPSVVSAVLRDYYAVRVDPPETRVRIAGTEPAPFALEYLYGEGWWGPLEAALYQALADPSLDRSDPAPFVAAATNVLEDFGIHLRGDRYATLDALLASLPRPTDPTTTYQPVATLVAIGLIMGDRLVSRYSRLDWIDGREIMARYFGFSVVDHGVLRPIDYVMQAYHGEIPRPISRYAELVGVHAAEN